MEASRQLISHPCRFTPVKDTMYLLYRRLCGPDGRFARTQNISSSPGFDSQTVKPVGQPFCGLFNLVQMLIISTTTIKNLKIMYLFLQAAPSKCHFK
jgi:hypothetical protein